MARIKRAIFAQPLRTYDQRNSLTEIGGLDSVSADAPTVERIEIEKAGLGIVIVPASAAQDPLLVPWASINHLVLEREQAPVAGANKGGK